MGLILIRYKIVSNCFFSTIFLLFKILNDYEIFEYDVQWQNGEEDTVLLIEFAVFEDCQIEVLWNYDPEWRGKTETVFDFPTIEVNW